MVQKMIFINTSHTPEMNELNEQLEQGFSILTTFQTSSGYLFLLSKTTKES